MSKVRCPSFRYHEGRARERRQIVDCFPSRGHVYFEPFAGAGNVFYEVQNRNLQYDEFVLSDCQPFLLDVLRCKMGQFPVTASRKVFEQWAATDTPEASVLARAITYGGKGYQAGFIGSLAYNRDSLLESVWSAKTMLKRAAITADKWDVYDYSKFVKDDLIYFDPPSRMNNYDRIIGDINHDALIDVLLRNCYFRWVITHKPDKWYENRLGSRFIVLDGPLYLWRNFH